MGHGAHTHPHKYTHKHPYKYTHLNTHPHSHTPTLTPSHLPLDADTDPMSRLSEVGAPIVIIEHPSSKYVNINVPMFLKCGVNNPDLVHTWYLNGTLVSHVTSNHTTWYLHVTYARRVYNDSNNYY